MRIRGVCGMVIGMVRQNFCKKIVIHCNFVQLNTLRTGDADLRFYITTVQDG